jgi:subtilisin family serine protease
MPRIIYPEYEKNPVVGAERSAVRTLPRPAPEAGGSILQDVYMRIHHSVPGSSSSIWLFSILLITGCATARVATDNTVSTGTAATTGSLCQASTLAESMRLADERGLQWWHLDEEEDCIRGISVIRTYRDLLADRQPSRTVVVAVIDSGVDHEHEDIRANIWVNPGEIAGTARDDDQNGYIDDIHGWNFIGNPDGRNVEFDTYEVTRLYVALKPLYEVVDEDTLSQAQMEERLFFLAVAEDFYRQRDEMQAMYEQISEIDDAVKVFTATLKSFLNTTELTREAIEGIRTNQPEILQARGAMLYLDDLGITPDVLEQERRQLEKYVYYAFNPEFDPRPIVGDNYEDPTERFYGNADVMGPDAGHGTHVAGIIGAVRGNDIGIDGIAPAVRIMAVRAVPDGDERDKDVANAIRYAVDNGAHIINMSFGKGYSPEKWVVDEAVRYADERGVLMVHAAGNSAEDLRLAPNYPSRLLNDGSEARLWIEVGAATWWAADSLAAPFTNFGAGHVDVFAPGFEMKSATPGNAYEVNSGTSMAAPVVSGLAALLMAYFPELNAAEVREIILESASNYRNLLVMLPGGDEGRVSFGDLSTTGGVVNAYRAVEMALQRETVSVIP